MLYRIETASGVFEVRSLDLAFRVARAFRWMCLLWMENAASPVNRPRGRSAAVGLE